jgi:hypothetical protein
MRLIKDAHQRFERMAKAAFLVVPPLLRCDGDVKHQGFAFCNGVQVRYLHGKALSQW